MERDWEIDGSEWLRDCVYVCVRVWGRGVHVCGCVDAGEEEG